jgi:hypothetical protein
VVVDAAVKRTTKTTLRSGRRGVFKNDLTGPTLLEISGWSMDESLYGNALILTYVAAWGWNYRKRFPRGEQKQKGAPI